MATLTIAMRLRDMLLRGETIKAAAAAQELGCSRQHVTNALLSFGAGARKVRYGLWGCGDADVLARWTPPVPAAVQKREHGRQMRMAAPDGCRELMRAWGLTVEPVAIPSSVSCRHAMKLD